MIYAWFVAFKGLPKWLHFLMAGVVAIILFLGAKALYDASVIDGYKQREYTESVEALEQSADQRARDSVDNRMDEQERYDEIEQASGDGVLSDPELRLNCLRLRKLGRNPEPCRHISGN